MEKFKLYPYQDNAVQNSVTMLYERENSLIVAGTGAGKTIMMAAAIGRFFNGFYATHKRKPHILVLVHRTEIHGQNHSKFSRVCPEIPTSEITASRKSLHGNVHFGMVQTVVGLLDEFERAKSFFDLIVIDEAHHAKASTYETIIDWNLKGKPNSALLGVTATPNRGDKLPLIHLFDNFYQITTKFLIDSHYLVRPRFVDLSPIFETEKGIEKGKLSKNCKMDLQGKALLSQLCDDYLREKEPGKAIIFTPSHEYSIEIYDTLKAKGRNPAYLSLGLDDVSRKSELERFETGDAEELINVDICTEGYDYPSLRNVIDFDTNGTHGQWVQKVGRGLRTADGKTSCTVIDFGGNVELYPGGVETDVDLNGVIKKPKGEKLSESDLFQPQPEEKGTADYILSAAAEHTPYHTPKGFETVNDTDFGIVFVACGSKRDCLITGSGHYFEAYMGNKASIKKSVVGTYSECVSAGMSWLGEQPTPPELPISNMQIRLLAPEYPTTALTWYGANCTICWKTWKAVIADG